MWADTLLALERTHVLRLIGWGVVSAIAGSLLLVLVVGRRMGSPMLHRFGSVLAAGGVIVFGAAVARWPSLAFRDHAAATQLVRTLWLNAGLDLGYIGVGTTLALSGWFLGRRTGALGAGMAIALHGLALLVLHLDFLSTVAGLL